MAKTIDLPDQVQTLTTALQNHLLSDVHADKDHDGRLSAMDFRTAMSGAGVRMWLNQPDLMTLPAGRYEVGGPTNGPAAAANAICEVEVAVGSSGGKQIWLTVSSTGQMWMYNTHTNNAVVGGGWRQINQQNVVWSGGLTTVNTQITFNQSVEALADLKIELMAGDGYHQAIVGVLSETSNIIFNNLDNTDYGLHVVELDLTYDQKSLKVTSAFGVTIATDGSITKNTNAGGWTIRKVTQCI